MAGRIAIHVEEMRIDQIVNRDQSFMSPSACCATLCVTNHPARRETTHHRAGKGYTMVNLVAAYMRGLWSISKMPRTLMKAVIL